MPRWSRRSSTLLNTDKGLDHEIRTDRYRGCAKTRLAREGPTFLRRRRSHNSAQGNTLGLEVPDELLPCKGLKIRSPIRLHRQY